MPDACTPSDAGRVYPEVSKIRDVSLNVAVAVGKVAIQSGMSKLYGPEHALHLRQIIGSKMYYPAYVPLVPRAGMHDN
ncbi:hypothetical protein T484DRAFT_1760963 [Baffinella frigidus]|nr:hypothetical protein T484DRAFT_1760963 [Cryptophyta sp. CCMP2293]